MSSFDLNRFDKTLALGFASFSPRFVRAQADFIRSRQMPDGGFAGRHDGSDLYYTDFAVRTWTLFRAEKAILNRVIEYLKNVSHPPRDIVECFNQLNLGRLLINWTPERKACEATLASQQLPNGGFARPGQVVISGYHTFLGALCLQMLGRETAMANSIPDQLALLKRRDGGYAEMPDQPASQTASTAATVMVLHMKQSLSAKDAQEAVQFFVRMQGPDGGVRSHATAPFSDLLSTFVALTALTVLDALPRLDLAGVARFVRQTAASAGGFRAGSMDDTPDVEYTYYGIATLAMLNRQR